MASSLGKSKNVNVVCLMLPDTSKRIGQHQHVPALLPSWLQLQMGFVFLLSTGGNLSVCCSDPLCLSRSSGAEAFEEARRMLGSTLVSFTFQNA